MNDISAKDFIYAIKNFPDLFFKQRYGIILDAAGDMGKIFRGMREEYIAKSDWLRYDINHEHWLNFEINKTCKSTYKPLAKVILDRFVLCKAVHAYPFHFLPEEDQNLIDISSKPLPFHWVFQCELFEFEQRLKNSGIIASLSHLPKSKSVTYSNQRKYCDQIAKVHNLNFRGKLIALSPLRALQNIAASIAKNDRDFRESEYLPYLKKLKANSRALRDSKLYVAFINEKGDFKMLKRGIDAR